MASQATAKWDGTLTQGKGAMHPAHAPEIPFSLGTRFEGKQGSNPEEVIGAALAGCFSMALSLGLEKGGMTPVSIQTDANVTLAKDGAGFAITKIELSTVARATGGDDAKFQAIAAETKRGCPVSKALAGTTITLAAKLASQ